MTPVQVLLDRIENVRPTGNGWDGRCPRHEDRVNSLCISEGADQKAVLYCQAGCNTEDVVHAAGLQMKDLFPTNGKTPVPIARKIVKTYPYVDESGNLLFEVVRYEPKGFKQRRPDGDGGHIWRLDDTRRVLYRLPRVIAAKKAKQPVLVVEGEEDVHALERLGLIATCNPGGAAKKPGGDAQAKKWRPEFSETLRGMKVVLIPDNDEAGQRHVQFIAGAVHGIAEAVKIVEFPELPDKGDISDWLSTGGTKEKLFELIEQTDRWQPSETSDTVSPVISRPTIVAKARPLRDVVADGVEAIREANDPPVLFVRNGKLTGVDFNETGRPVLTRWTTARVRFHASKAADWIVQLKESDKHIAPPQEAIESIMVLGEWPLPPLIGITESPVLRSDGSILEVPGYDEDTRLFYAPSPGFKFAPVPVAPSQTDVANALLTLNDVLQDFPFVDKATHANALGALLTVTLRPLIEGPVPLFLFDKPKPGTGSSLLVDVKAKIATGRTPTLMTAPDDDQEMRKKITATLDEGASLPVFDNVSDSISSDSLSAAITAEEWSDRRLGRNENVHFTTRNTTWFMTGNNLRLRGDLARRSVWIRIDAKTSRPWEGRSFKYPDLPTYVQNNRGALLSAILCLGRAWIRAGRPKPSVSPIGSFEKWTHVVGGILEHAGVPDFLANRVELLDLLDDDHTEWTAFLTAIHYYFQSRTFKTGELCEAMSKNQGLADALPDMGKFEGDLSKKLGRMLSKRIETRYEGFRLVGAGTAGNARKFKVVGDAEK